MASASPASAAASAADTAVVLVNLGTPDEPNTAAVRRYLAEFLHDRRVVDMNRWLWCPLLHFAILPLRSGKVAHKYASVWLPEGSPLAVHTRRLAESLQRELPQLRVLHAMRYGKPEVSVRIQALLDQGCDRILLVPLYPQYAAATSATACDQAFKALMQMRWQPTVRVSPPYHDDPVYIEAIAQSIREGLAKLDFEPEVILTSFHGVPKSYLLKGDPYHCQCVKTGRLIREALGFSPERMRTTFQSRFGNEEWLKPYTDETVQALAKSGVKRMAIVAPRFTADCLETLEELDGENRHYFEENGGERFAYIPCLNDGDLGMRVIEHVVARELKGWV